MGYQFSTSPDLGGPLKGTQVVPSYTLPTPPNVIPTTIQLTQAQYDALAVKDPKVLYTVVG